MCKSGLWNINDQRGIARRGLNIKYLGLNSLTHLPFGLRFLLRQFKNHKYARNLFK